MIFCRLCSAQIKNAEGILIETNFKYNNLMKTILKVNNFEYKTTADTCEKICTKCYKNLGDTFSFFEIIRLGQIKLIQRETYLHGTEIEENLLSATEYNEKLDATNCMDMITTDSVDAAKHIVCVDTSEIPKRKRQLPVRYRDDISFQPKVIINKHSKKCEDSSVLIANLSVVALIHAADSCVVGELLEAPSFKHSSRLRLKCQLCGDVFSLENYFKRHLTEHKINFDNNKSKNEEYSGQCNIFYNCKICTKTFTEHSLVRRHYKYCHSEERSLKCTQCAAIFKYKFNLDYHMNKHTEGSKSFACSFCNKRFLLQHELKIHSRIHTGEKPFKCLICLRSFAHHSNLVSHRKTVHSETKSFECNICSAAFKTKRYLLTHHKIHQRKLNNISKELVVPARSNLSVKGTIENSSATEKVASKENLTSNLNGKAEIDQHTELDSYCHPDAVGYVNDENVITSSSSLLLKNSPSVYLNSSEPLKEATDIPCSFATNGSANTTILLPKNFKIIQIPKNSSNLSFNSPTTFKSATVSATTTIPATLPHSDQQSFQNALETSLDTMTANKVGNKSLLSFNSSGHAFNLNSIKYVNINSDKTSDESPDLTTNKTLDLTSNKTSNTTPDFVFNKIAHITSNSNSSITSKQTLKLIATTAAKHPLKATNRLSLLKSSNNAGHSIQNSIPRCQETKSPTTIDVINTIPPEALKPVITKIEILPPLNTCKLLQNYNLATASSSSQSFIPTTSAIVNIPPQYKFQCGKCLKYFKQKSALTKHERTHTNQKPYKCSLCPKAYADASNFKKHKMLHKHAAEKLKDLCKRSTATSKPILTQFNQQHHQHHHHHQSHSNQQFSPTHSTASDPDPDGLELTQKYNNFDSSTTDNDDNISLTSSHMENELWENALNHIVRLENVQDNIKQNLFNIHNGRAIMTENNMGNSLVSFSTTSLKKYEDPD